MLGNRCVYSQTYWMLNQNQKNVVLSLKNIKAEPIKLVISCGLKKKQKGHSKINDQIKHNLYTWITCHLQVFQPPICNDCLKVMLYDQTETQLVPKLLLLVSVRELHNSLVSDPNYGGLKDDKYEDSNIIISDYTLCSLLPHQLKKYLHVTRSCVVVNVVFLLKVYIHRCYPGVIDI